MANIGEDLGSWKQGEHLILLVDEKGKTNAGAFTRVVQPTE